MAIAPPITIAQLVVASPTNRSARLVALMDIAKAVTA